VAGDAELLGHAILKVEDEPVFTAPREQVQVRPKGVQHRLMKCQLAGFFCGEEPACCEARPGAIQPQGQGNPTNHLQVSEPTRALLYIGL